MTLKFKMGFNQYGAEPELFLTTAPSAPPSLYDGEYLEFLSNDMGSNDR